MPSLQALEKFKSSFTQIGGEPDVLAALELPIEDFPLPEEEAAAEPSPGETAGAEGGFGGSEAGAVENDSPGGGADEPGDGAGTDYIDFGDLGDLLGGADNLVPDLAGEGEAAGPGPADVDFGAFIDGIPDDFAPPAGDNGGALDGAGNDAALDTDAAQDGSETPPDDFELPLDDFAEPAENAGFPSAAAPGSEDDFSLDGLAPDGEDSLSMGGEPVSDDFAPAEELDLDNLPGFDMDEPPAADASPDFSDPEPGDTGDFGAPAGELDLDSLPGFDMDEFPAADEKEGVSEAPGGDADVDGSSLDEESGAFPLELLDGFADEIETGRAADASPDSPDPGPGDAGDFGADAEELDLDSLPGFDMDDFPAADEKEGASEVPGAGAEFPDFDEAAGELGDALDFSLPGEIVDADAALSGGAEAEDSDKDEDGFDLGGELRDFDSGAVLEELPGDPFDNFKLDAGVPAENAAVGAALDADAGGFGEMDEFALPGIDAIPGGRSAPAGRASRGAAGAGPAADEVEEITLDDEDMEALQETLSSYPLNLRIACEELIAEQAVAPDRMSRLIKLLVDGAPARETAALAGKILDRTIPIPKGFEKKTGEELEAEQSSFAYIFAHSFLPALRIFAVAAAALLCAGYLCWKFIYTPIKAENIYRLGYERIGAGEYARANERFREAFKIHEKKPWFYEYARAFREARQYTFAEEKYQELLYYTASKSKRGIPEKAAVLEFAAMETASMGNYEKADRLIRRNILDYYPSDADALLALGDNSLAWGEYEPSRLEDAREAYAMIMERYGRSDPLLERMLKYFIRSDNLEETLALHSYFMASEKREISAAALAELGGYFLDKRFEKVRGVPNQYLERISGIRELLFRAIERDPELPESYYHLARYYQYFENDNDEKLTLDMAVKVFEAAGEESPRRVKYHINALRRHGEVLVNWQEFFSAEESLVKAANLYQDALSRRLLARSPEFGKLYADLGDLEYFVKDGDMRTALDYYRLGEAHGWAPPETQYRMGAAHYQLREWGPALDRIFAAYRETPPNRRILYALGNVSYMRGNYFAAQGYYDRLLEILDADRGRLPPIMASDDETQMELAERLMVAQNNLGVTLDALAERTGDNGYRSRAQGLYSDSERAWDILTRNPQSMLRMRPSPDIGAPGVNPAYLNVQNSLHPTSGSEPQFFLRIDKDILEPSVWEDLSPPGYRLSEGIYTGR